MNRQFQLLICFLVFTTCISNIDASAQIDLKVEPFGIILNAPILSAEYIVTNNISFEGSIGAEYGRRSENGDQHVNGIGVALSPRFYFNPKKIADRFYIGWSAQFNLAKYRPFNNQSVAFSYTNIRLLSYFYTGYKWIDDNRFSLDIGLGAGRKLLNDFILENGGEINIGNREVEIVGHAKIGYRLFRKENRKN